MASASRFGSALAVAMACGVVVASQARQAPVSASGGWQTQIHSARDSQDELRASAGDRVFFSAGSAELGARARTVLNAQAAWLVRHPEFKVIIEGHADDPVSDADALSARRADAVRLRLVAEGVAAHRISVTPLGKSHPVAVCPQPECAAQNRRAVTRVVFDASGQRALSPTLASDGSIGTSRWRSIPTAAALRKLNDDDTSRHTPSLQ